MEVVAEGIETNEQAVELRRLGCNFGQGYLFSKPLASSAAAALLEAIQPLAQRSDAAA
jgi:EAL domain-containing protein (putative c-di-GMP-specific phosphodiesterase class I)